MKGTNYTQSMGISADHDYIYTPFPDTKNKPNQMPDYSSLYRDRIGERDAYLDRNQAEIHRKTWTDDYLGENAVDS